MSTQTSFKKYQVLGVDIDALTINQAITYICDLASQTDSPAVYVTKPYVEHLDRASRDKQVKALLNGSRLCLADGIAPVWASSYLYGSARGIKRLIGSLVQTVLNPSSLHDKLPQKIAGINFTWPLLQECQKRNLKLFLVGSPRQQTIEYTVDVLRHKLSGLNIVGSFPGDISRQDELLAKLGHSQPDIVLVGVGFPRQEQLMAWLAPQLKHGVLIGEGGTFDYRQFGGSVPRAAGWVQRINLEWLWRLILEPKRLIRQLAIPRFIYKVYRQGQML